MTKPNLNVMEQRIKDLEAEVGRMTDQLDAIRTNHIPHIQASIDSLRTEVRVWAGINVGAIIVGLLIVRVFKI